MTESTKTAAAADVNAAIAGGTAPADLEGGDAAFYCPGCGTRYDTTENHCTGKAEAPHAAIAVVSTKELAGDPEKHTAAPTPPQA